MLFTLLFISGILGKEHTTVYEENWETTKNRNYMFFDDRTFGKDIFDDPCILINNNQKYQKFINEKINCLGKWCVNQQFSCKSKPCYEVDHIIDKNNPEYDDEECVMIAGNLVMAYSKWNSGLGGIKGKNNYKKSEHEKTIVYGEKVINDVRKIIEKCNPNCKNNYLKINNEINTEKNNIIKKSDDIIEHKNKIKDNFIVYFYIFISILVGLIYIYNITKYEYFRVNNQDLDSLNSV